MNHDPLRPDPFQERDLPNPEAMLASILEGASTTQDPEELDNLDYIGRRPRRWLQVVAAAAAVAVIAGIGWQVTRPQMRAGEPGSRPTPVQTATPTPTPTPDVTVVPEPSPTATRTPTPRRTPTPSAKTTPTATPTSRTPSPSATPSATQAAIEGPRVIVTEARRGPVSREGFEIAQVDFVACPGSRGARMWGPFVEGAGVTWEEADKLGPTGALVNRNVCIPVTIDVEVPAGKPTEITIGVQVEYAADTPEAVNNGMVYGSAIIR